MLVSSSNHHNQIYRFSPPSSLTSSSGGLHGSPPSSSYSPSCSISAPHHTNRYTLVPYRTPRIVCRSHSSSASTTVNTGGNPSMVAIDSKIEQAMDLVKTHLMFAVREEVEVLRGRIVDLENTVCNLEAENAVLRQHVSEEILRNMNN